jgi:DNA-binding PadR family transcriptional regulator
MLIENPSSSQEALARNAGVVPSMVNRYLKDFEEDGLIMKEGGNRRNMEYILSRDGQYRLQYLTIAFLSEVARLYSESQGIFRDVFDYLNHGGYRHLILYGAGIIGGILIDALKTEGYEIMGFVDDSSLKQNETFRGVRVFPPETASNIVYDAVIIASFRHAERIRQRALTLNLKSVLIFRIANDGKVSLAPSESLPNV